MIKVPESSFIFVVAVVVFGLQLFIVWLVKKIIKRRKVVPYLLFFSYNRRILPISNNNHKCKYNS